MEADLFGTRKTIQEVDCLALDMILVTGFDWREIANRLSSSGCRVPPGALGELQLYEVLYRMAHSACRVEGGFSAGITRTLNHRYRDQIELVSHMDPAALCSHVHRLPMEGGSVLAGFLWALATDPREGAEKILKVFNHRMVTHLLRSAYRPSGREALISGLL